LAGGYVSCMDAIDGVHGDDVGGGGLRIAQASAEEQAAIRAMLSKRVESAPAGAAVGRASALAWAGLRLAALVLLAAGVGVGLGDGDEFDDVGCSVAQQPGGTSHGARSAQARERAGGKLPGSDSGSAGGSGDGGPCGGKAETRGQRTEDRGQRMQGGRKAETLKAETFPINLLKRVLDSTPEQQAAMERFLNGQPLPEPQQGAVRSAPKQVLAERPSQGGTECGPAYVFRWTGRRWEVVWRGGRPFWLLNTFGARYLNYLLHEPNELIRAFDLEVEVQPQKGSARVVDSIQPESDPQALREYRQELRRLKAERANTLAAGGPGEVEGLDSQIAALELALKGRGAAADTGERARDNVRKAIAVVLEQLKGGGLEEKAFADHLRTHLSIGHECLYSQPEGRVWG